MEQGLQEGIRKLERRLLPHEQEINQAGLFCSYDQLANFAAAAKRFTRRRDFSNCELLREYLRLTELECDYLAERTETVLRIAQAIDHNPLSLRDFYTFCITPINIKSRGAISPDFLGLVSQFAHEGRACLPARLLNE